jgi:hypothetical protein
MRKFVVVVRGENCRLWRSGLRRHWFYVTRYLDGTDAAAAERLALAQVRADPRLVTALHNAPDDPPRFAVEEIVEVESFAGIADLTPGFYFAGDAEPRAGVGDDERR